MKKNLSVRLLSGLVCSLVAGAVLFVAEPTCATSWSTSSGGSGWGNSDSTPDSGSGSGWGSSGSDSGSDSAWSTPKSGSTWGSSGSSFGSGSSNSGSSCSPCQQQSQQQSYNMPDPLQQINHEDYKYMVSQFRGKIVMVNFFASWCGPCRQEIADLKALRQRFSQDDLIIISVSIDQNKSDLMSVLQELNFNYPTAWAGDDLKRAFNIQSIPRMVVYDRTGDTWLDEVGALPRQDLFQMVQEMVNF